MARSGAVGSNIVLGIRFYVDGALFDPYQVDNVNIYDAASGGNLLDTLVPVRVSLGYWQATFGIPEDFDIGTYYDQWTWTAESVMSSNTQRYSFEVVAATEEVEEAEPVSANACPRPRPTWTNQIGLRVAQSVGNGMGVQLNWEVAIPSSADLQVHYNIYHATTRVGVFEDPFLPVAITTDTRAIINVTPGNLHYFAIKATEFDPEAFDITTLTQIGDGIGQYPEPTILTQAIDAYGANVMVENNSNFPPAGYLLIGTEILQYSTVGTNVFYVEDTQRGAFTTNIDTHSAGDEVKLWRGVEDGNSIIVSHTAAWHESNGTPRNVEAVGQFNVDEDGYRANNEDIVTTNLSSSDSDMQDFPSFDYTGYHRPSIQETFSGECVGSYVGGEFNGSRGLNFVDRSMARLDAMLQVTGEPVVFLRRKQTGRRCRCQTLRRENQRFRCQYCFGTSFDRGYDRFFNNRPISESYTNTEGRILIRTSPYADDVKLEQGQGLTQPMEVTAWTTNFPGLKDRDIIVRFNSDNSEEFRYEILDVTRNKLIFNEYGKQDFRIRRLDKTDIVYQYNINNSEFYVYI